MKDKEYDEFHCFLKTKNKKKLKKEAKESNRNMTQQINCILEERYSEDKAKTNI